MQNETFLRKRRNEGEEQKCFMCFTLCKSIRGSVVLMWIKCNITVALLCLQWMWSEECLQNTVALPSSQEKMSHFIFFFNERSLFFIIILQFFFFFNEEKSNLGEQFDKAIPSRVLTLLCKLFYYGKACHRQKIFSNDNLNLLL